MDILNKDERIFQSWGSVEIVDKEGEVIPMNELKKIMPTLMDRGGTLIDQHSNRQIGKILNFEFKKHPESEKEGLLITGKIYKDYDLDNEVWNSIKRGEKKGLSFGGRANDNQLDISFKDFNSTKPADILRQIEGYEFSVVDEPANQFATMTDVNMLAKGSKGAREREIVKANQTVKKPFAGYKDFDDCVAQNKQTDDPEAFCASIQAQVEGVNKKYSKSDDMVKKQDEELLERLSSLEARLQDIEGSLAPAEDVSAQDDDEEEKKNKQDEEEDKQDEEEENKGKQEDGKDEEEDKGKQDDDEEEDSQKQDGGDTGTTEVNPPKDGGDATLPESVSEKIEDEEGTDEATDEVTIAEKMEKLDKQVKNINKSLMKLGVASTPRQKQVAKARTQPKTINKAQDVLKKMRSGKIVDLSDLRKQTAEEVKTQHEQALGKIFN